MVPPPIQIGSWGGGTHPSAGLFSQVLMEVSVKKLSLQGNLKARWS